MRATPYPAVRELPSTAAVATFPLGGIGTGNVSLGTRGELRDWEIWNAPNKGGWLPFTFFAIRAHAVNSSPVTRVLEARLPPPHEGVCGLGIGAVAGLPRLEHSTFRGEYPIATVEFHDARLPVNVTLTAFSPLVPLHPNDSGIPAAMLRYAVHNPGPTAVDVSIAGSLASPVGVVGRDWSGFPEYAGVPSVGWRDEQGIRGLTYGTDLVPYHPSHGSAALVTTATAHQVSATPCWTLNRWHDGVQQFWDTFRSTGQVAPSDLPRDPTWSARHGLRVGSLAITQVVPAGESREFEFVLAWYQGNRVRAWNGISGLPSTNADQIVRNHYAARYSDAWQVAADLVARLPELEGATREFHRALFESSLPGEVIDAVSATLVVARSTTCFVLEDGTPDGQFAAWEGSLEQRGSCEGTCTHVWNYAQSLAYLFPSLERSARANEFLREVTPDGRMRFRSNAVFNGDPHEYHPAIDGQLGAIIRLYREWRFCGDDEFARVLWPHAVRAMEYSLTQWDPDGDFVLEGEQHNTYDIEFFGQNPLASSLSVAALRAMAALAGALEESTAVARYAEIAELASRRSANAMFNGEYFVQRVTDADAHPYQFGLGCLADQLLGQTFAHLVGLGHVFPVEQVRSALLAILRHNFITDFSDYDSVQRTFALNDEAGLVLCTWPRGGRPRYPFPYSDEVWSGIEYQVATNLIYEGLVEEGLTLVRAVRGRHDGFARNPWNETECGNHYARSMASWGF